MNTDLKLSFEFFPPRSEAQAMRFWRTLGCLETLQPEWFSLTYGALGSASQASIDTLTQYYKDKRCPMAAHLTCAGQTRAQLEAQLTQFRAIGINHLVVLRGDLTQDRTSGKYYHYRYASELVELVQEIGDFDISVACYPETHPEATSAITDLDVLKHKMSLGAKRGLSQFFFDASVFLRWRDAAVQHGIDMPLIPGILPVHDIEKIKNFSQRCGASVPKALIEQFSKAASAAELQSIAIDQCVELCQVLQGEGVDTFHFYTLNQSDLSYQVAQRLLGSEAGSAAA